MKKLLLFAAIAISTQLINAQDYYWPLKTDLNDIKGGKNGTNNGVQFKKDAVRGDVAHFDGNSFANLPSFINGNTAITVAVWFKMDSVRPWSRIYTFGKGDQSEPKDVMMVIPKNGLPEDQTTSGWFRFTLSTDGPWLDADVEPTLANVEVGKWYYSVMVVTPDSVIGFFNDQVIIEEEFARDLSTMDDTQNALGKSFWPDKLWAGALSDLRVYKKALTRAEVVALYNETKIDPGTAVSSVSSEKVSVFAANNKIMVKNGLTSGQISVYNLTGALVHSGPVSTINKVEFNSGVYLVKVTGANFQQTAKVIIK